MTSDAEQTGRLLRLAEITNRLRKGQRICDFELDYVFPFSVRRRSSTFWTPVSVARRAAELLANGRRARVLDVGSGIGKLCIVGAITTGARFVGVEHREHLVHVAKAAAAQLGATTSRFFHGDFAIVDVTTFDAIYMFNPFEETCWPPEDHLDDEAPHSPAKFIDDVRRAEALLASARRGTRVVTYHGFGGRMPEDYRLLLREPHHTDHLELWLKT